MAKVRIQARSGDVDDVIETSDEHPHQKQVKHAGAVEILARVWKREGFTGWYQVCRITSSAMLLVIQWARYRRECKLKLQKRCYHKHFSSCQKSSSSTGLLPS